MSIFLAHIAGPEANVCVCIIHIGSPPVGSQWSASSFVSWIPTRLPSACRHVNRPPIIRAGSDAIVGDTQVHQQWEIPFHVELDSHPGKSEGGPRRNDRREGLLSLSYSFDPALSSLYRLQIAASML